MRGVWSKRQSVGPETSRLDEFARARKLSLEATEDLSRGIADVAFDEFIFDADALVDGTTMLEYGVDRSGTCLAVASVQWTDMPVEWIALQSRNGPNFLGIGEEMEPVGHQSFDDAYAVDADDPSEVRRLFRTSLREWLVEFDTAHGPLIIIFDGQPASDIDEEMRDALIDRGAMRDAAGDHPSAVYVARAIHDDDALGETLTIATKLAEHVRSTLHD